VPIALFGLGILGIVLAINDSVGQFGTTFTADMTGAQGQVGFFAWIAAIVVIAFVGRVTGLTMTAKLFIVLIALSFVFAQPSVWTNITSAVGAAQTPTPSATMPPLAFTLPQQSANSPAPATPQSTVATAGGIVSDLESGNIGGAIGLGSSLWG
jgi:hypothetical protein